MLWAKLVELVLYPPTVTGKNYIQNECGVQRYAMSSSIYKNFTSNTIKCVDVKWLKGIPCKSEFKKNTKTILISEKSRLQSKENYQDQRVIILT